MSELKPCPFCGGSVSVIPCCHLDEYTDESSYSWAIRHNDLNSGCRCSLNLPGEYRTLECKEADAQKQRLIAAWNSRAATTIGKVQVEIEPALHGTLTAEQVREVIESNSWAETSSIREFNDSSWQAIADELNATLKAATNGQ